MLGVSAQRSATTMFITRFCAILLSSSVIFAIADTRRGHLEPLGNSGSVEPLHEQSGFIEPRKFLEEYVLKNRPVLMRGAILDSPAIKLWTDEYLMSKAEMNPEAMIDLEYGKKETRLNGTTKPFHEFLKIYNKSDVYMVSRMPSFLESDLVIPWPLQCEDYKRSFEDNVMWFSSGGTKSVIHHDGYENLNCLFRGKKRFLFVNTTKYPDLEPKIIDFQNGSYGSVDVEKVDLDKYPFYDGLEFFKAEMNPGDCVYSPYLWIHQVESWGSNIAVNIWWFREINKLVNVSTCSKEYNSSMTLKAVNFHRTTILEDARDSAETAFVLRHSIARLIFTKAGKDNVDVKTFVKLMTGKRPEKDHVTSLVSLFRILDINRNKKFEVADLSEGIGPDEDETLKTDGVQWMSVARIFGYPLPVDFSNDDYKLTKPFSAAELLKPHQVSGEEQSDSPEETKMIPEKEPVLKDLHLDTLGSRDEL